MSDRIEMRPETRTGLADKPGGRILRATGESHEARAAFSRQAAVYGRRTVEFATPLTGGPLGNFVHGQTYTVEHEDSDRVYRWTGAEPIIDTEAGLARFTLDIAKAFGVYAKPKP